MSDFNLITSRLPGAPGAATAAAITGTVPDPPRNFAALDNGTILRGTVQGRDKDGLINISTDQGIIKIASSANLPTGSNVTLEVRSVGDRLQVLVLAVEQGTQSGNATAAQQPGGKSTAADGSAGPQGGTAQTNAGEAISAEEPQPQSPVIVAGTKLTAIVIQSVPRDLLQTTRAAISSGTAANQLPGQPPAPGGPSAGGAAATGSGPGRATFTAEFLETPPPPVSASLIPEIHERIAALFTEPPAAPDPATQDEANPPLPSVKGLTLPPEVRERIIALFVGSPGEATPAGQSQLGPQPGSPPGPPLGATPPSFASAQPGTPAPLPSAAQQAPAVLQPVPTPGTLSQIPAASTPQQTQSPQPQSPLPQSPLPSPAPQPAAQQPTTTITAGLPNADPIGANPPPASQGVPAPAPAPGAPPPPTATVPAPGNASAPLPAPLAPAPAPAPANQLSAAQPAPLPPGANTQQQPLAAGQPNPSPAVPGTPPQQSAGTPVQAGTPAGASGTPPQPGANSPTGLSAGSPQPTPANTVPSAPNQTANPQPQAGLPPQPPVTTPTGLPPASIPPAQTPGPTPANLAPQPQATVPPPPSAALSTQPPAGPPPVPQAGQPVPQAGQPAPAAQPGAPLPPQQSGSVPLPPSVPAAPQPQPPLNAAATTTPPAPAPAASNLPPQPALPGAVQTQPPVTASTISDISGGLPAGTTLGNADAFSPTGSNPPTPPQIPGQAPGQIPGQSQIPVQGQGQGQSQSQNQSQQPGQAAGSESTPSTSTPVTNASGTNSPATGAVVLPGGTTIPGGSSSPINPASLPPVTGAPLPPILTSPAGGPVTADPSAPGTGAGTPTPPAITGLPGQPALTAVLLAAANIGAGNIGPGDWPGQQVPGPGGQVPPPPGTPVPPQGQVPQTLPGTGAFPISSTQPIMPAVPPASQDPAVSPTSITPVTNMPILPVGTGDGAAGGQAAAGRQAGTAPASNAGAPAQAAATGNPPGNPSGTVSLTAIVSAGGKMAAGNNAAAANAEYLANNLAGAAQATAELGEVKLDADMKEMPTGPLPTGTELRLRVINIQQPGLPAAITNAQANMAAAGKPVIAGQILGHTPAGHPVIHTPLGDLVLQQQANLPVGAQITLALEGMEMANAAASMTAAITPQMAALNLAQGWPTLMDLLFTLQQGGGSAGMGGAAAGSSAADDPAALAHLPQAGAKLAAGMANAVDAFRTGDFEKLFGPLSTALKATGGKQDSIRKLRDEFTQLSSLAQDRGSTDWRTFFLPLWNDGRLQQINLFYRRPKRGQGDDKDDDATRFVVDVSFTRLGGCQLDGLIRKKKFDLMIRSHRELPLPVKRDIAGLFAQARELGNYAGDLSFQTTTRFPVSPLDDVVKDNPTVTA